MYRNSQATSKAQSQRPKTSKELRLAFWRYRHLLIALAIGIAVMGFARLFAPAANPTVTVLAAARPIAIGAVITEDDLAATTLPIGAGIDWLATDPTAAIGRTALANLPAGTPIWLALISSGELSALAPSGTVIVAVTLDQAVASLLAPGDRADLVELNAGNPTHLARSALVLPPRAAATGASGILSAVGTGGNAATLFAVSPQEAPPLAVAARLGQVSAILVG